MKYAAIVRQSTVIACLYHTVDLFILCVVFGKIIYRSIPKCAGVKKVYQNEKNFGLAHLPPPEPFVYNIM